ncbi:MAG: hypothetical protein ACOX6V_03725 [Patescibacteria group bacterium]|jgi:hypothetical protein
MTQRERSPSEPNSFKKEFHFKNSVDNGVFVPENEQILTQRTRVLWTMVNLRTGHPLGALISQAATGPLPIELTRKEIVQAGLETEFSGHELEEFVRQSGYEDIYGVDKYVQSYLSLKEREEINFEPEPQNHDVESVERRINTIVFTGPPASSKTATFDGALRYALFFGRGVITDMFDEYIEKAEEFWGSRAELEMTDRTKAELFWNRLSWIMYLGIKVSKITQEKGGSVRHFNTLFRNYQRALSESATPSVVNEEWVAIDWDTLAKQIAEEIMSTQEIEKVEVWGNAEVLKMKPLHLIEFPAVRGIGLYGDQVTSGYNRCVSTLRHMIREQRLLPVFARNTIFIGHTPNPIVRKLATSIRNEVITAEHSQDAIQFLQERGIIIDGLPDTPENNLKVQQAFARMAPREAIEGVNNEIDRWYKLITKISGRDYAFKYLPQEILQDPVLRANVAYILHQNSITSPISDLSYVAYNPPVEKVYLSPRALGIQTA